MVLSTTCPHCRAAVDVEEIASLATCARCERSFRPAGLLCSEQPLNGPAERQECPIPPPIPTQQLATESREVAKNQAAQTTPRDDSVLSSEVEVERPGAVPMGPPKAGKHSTSGAVQGDARKSGPYRRPAPRSVYGDDRNSETESASDSHPLPIPKPGGLSSTQMSQDDIVAATCVPERQSGKPAGQPQGTSVLDRRRPTASANRQSELLGIASLVLGAGALGMETLGACCGLWPIGWMMGVVGFICAFFAKGNVQLAGIFLSGAAVVLPLLLILAIAVTGS